MEPRISAPKSPSTADPARYRCVAPRSFVWDVAGAGVASELLRGEDFLAVHSRDGWLIGDCAHDSYAGRVHTSDFSLATSDPTHCVDVRAGLVFAGPSIKSPLIERLSLGTRLEARATEGDFTQIDGGYIHHRHIAPVDTVAGDPVDWATLLLGTPYLWGGRSSDGIDCSGLVQLSLGMAGIAAPRDSGPQRDALGTPLALDALARGDLIFVPGHVGMMVDAAHLLHANAHWMAVVVEPLADVLARLPPDTPVEARRL